MSSLIWGCWPSKSPALDLLVAQRAVKPHFLSRFSDLWRIFLKFWLSLADKELEKAPKHPAKYSEPLYQVFVDVLRGLEAKSGGFPRVLDPMAGVGGIHRLREWGYETYGVELEPEWASQSPYTSVGDATALDFNNSTFDAVVVSPPYANRMADHHEAKDKSRRHTYRHYLGRPLTEGSGAGYQWGDEYRQFCWKAWSEVRRVLRPGGLFILNIKNHIRNGEVIDVTAWHVELLLTMGFYGLKPIKVELPGQRHGANRKLRVDYESVLVFRKA